MPDILIACLFPAMLFLGFRLSVFSSDVFYSIWTDFLSLFSPPTININQDHTSGGPFSIRTSIAAYSQYRSLSLHELSRMRASYATLGRKHKRIGYEIGYPKKLDRLTEIIELNGKVTDGIVTAMKRSYTLDSSASWDAWLALSSTYKEPLIDSRCLSRIREVLKHFVRDWSDAGLSERTVIFEPIFSVLSMLSSSSRAQKRVLVPGSGLCRLAYDISTLGYDTTACELSGYMNGAFRFLLDPETTTTTSQHEVHPYGHWWSHSRNIVDLFRGVRFPDVIPRLAMDAEVGLHLKEGDFLTMELGTPNSYDYVVTLFFIDTSVNILSTLERIHTLLKPGGIWINLGPLLWCSDAQARLELSLEEVFEAMDAVGFVVVGGTDGNDDDEPDCMKRRFISCEYTHDEQAMMRWIYEAEFWVAKKV